MNEINFLRDSRGVVDDLSRGKKILLAEDVIRCSKNFPQGKFYEGLGVHTEGELIFPAGKCKKE